MGECMHQTGKTTAIRRIAVRETHESRHHMGAPENPQTITQYYRIEWFGGGPQSVPHYAERRSSLQQRM